MHSFVYVCMETETPYQCFFKNNKTFINIKLIITEAIIIIIIIIY